MSIIPTILFPTIIFFLEKNYFWKKNKCTIDS